MSENEYSHILKMDQIGEGHHAELAANENERKALADRFDLIAIDQLEADLILSREGDVIRADGELRALATQPCIASGEPVKAEISEPLNLVFLPEPEHGVDEEIELEEEDCDVIFHNGKALDLGEAVAQSLALALDPYPRSPNAEAALQAAGVKSEEEERVQSSPFAALAALKNKS